jgi:CheY-like chemotaxis protein
VQTNTEVPTCPLENVKVLVVDDDEDSRDLLAEVLIQVGAAVTPATSALDALGKTGPFDVVVSDIAMPDLDGYALMRRLRCTVDAATLPAIALSGYSRPEDERLALEAGYQRLLSKPVAVTDLVTTIRDLVLPKPATVALAS